MPRNIAFKCTYNDSLGNEKHSKIGFNGTCSDEIIKYNIEAGRSWCNNSPCKQYYENRFKSRKPNNPCYESNIFTNWEYDAGWSHNGIQGNVPRKIVQAGTGNLAVLTTLFPEEDEEERKIFGCFKIGKIIDEENDATRIIARDEIKVKFNYKEADKLLFWNYYQNDNAPNKSLWGTGLFRYLDNEILNFLEDAYNIVESKNKKDKLKKLINHYSDIYKKPEIIATIRENNGVDVVKINDKVKIKDVQTEKVYNYKIVNPKNTDIEENNISKESPIGNTLLNSELNKIVNVETPRGIDKYKIIDINS